MHRFPRCRERTGPRSGRCLDPNQALPVRDDRPRLGGLCDSSAHGAEAAQEPCGYTRIGPALRHAQELLASEKARRKIILLVTDGRPCDYDRYEGRHGIKDVKKAIETGRLHGIQTHAFAVEKQAAEFFPAMFTRHSYDIVPSPSRLASSMCVVFTRLLVG